MTWFLRLVWCGVGVVSGGCFFVEAIGGPRCDGDGCGEVEIVLPQPPGSAVPSQLTVVISDKANNESVSCLWQGPGETGPGDGAAGAAGAAGAPVLSSEWQCTPDAVEVLIRADGSETHIYEEQLNAGVDGDYTVRASTADYAHEGPISFTADSQGDSCGCSLRFEVSEALLWRVQ